MPDYAPQASTSKGVALVFNPAANGDRVPAGSELIVRNTSVAAITVTMVTPLVLDGDLTVADRISDPVATTGVNLIKVPNTEVYRGTDGMVTINFSATTNVNYAVIS